MLLTIYCCGTCSNSFDAFGDMERPADEWDKQPKEFEELTKKAMAGDAEAKAKWESILQSRRGQTKLRHTYFEGEIVSTLAKNDLGREYGDWILIDGPGSGNYQDKMLWAKPGNYSAARGVATGAGMDEAVRHALAVLKGEMDPSLYERTVEIDELGLVRESPAEIELHGLDKITGKPTSALAAVTPQMLQQQIGKMTRVQSTYDRVNLIGWSRGAVTCFMVANAIQDALADGSLPKIEVRIFAVDPVPGGINEVVYSAMTQLPSCVKHYFGVYARDEVSVGFTPVVPKTDPGTLVDFLPLPGMHSTVAGTAFIDKHASLSSDFDLKGPGRVTRFWAESALGAWGTKLKRTADYSNQQLFDMYEEMVKADQEFQKMRNYAYLGLKQGDWFSRYRKFYKQDPSNWVHNYLSLNDLAKSSDDFQMMFVEEGRVFVNWHHRVLYDLLKPQSAAQEATLTSA
jgi:hypothetical protein